MRKNIQLAIGIPVLLWICAAAAAQAAESRIALVREAVVDATTISLADLLPKSAPPTVRLAAQEVVVAESPRPGSVRVLSKDSLVHLLDGGGVRNEFEVPDEIVVRRAGRTITKEEVTDAISATLRHNEEFSNLKLTPENVRFNAAVLVPTANADLQVTRIEVDPVLHEMNFWLVSGADPALMPFVVMARPEDASSGLSALAEGAGGSARGLEDRLRAMRLTHAAKHGTVAAIVETGKPAQLHLTSGTTTEMFLAATPLERGALGQRIRVRLETTGRVLEAQVVGPGRVEAEF